MIEEKCGFYVRYSSPRALQRDHSTELAHGGMLVPWKDSPPAPNTSIVIRVQAPDQTTFEIAGRVLSGVPKRGFRVNFDPVSQNRGRSALDMYLKGALFRRLIDAERLPGPGTPPVIGLTVEAFGDIDFVPAEDQVTDPRLAHAEGGRDTEEIPSETEVSAGGSETEARDTESVDMSPAELGPEAEAGEGDFALETEAIPTGFRKPGPGEQYVVYAVKYEAVRDFAAIAAELRRTQRLMLAVQEDRARAGAICQLRLTLPGHNIYKMFGAIERVTADSIVLWFDENNESYRQACLYVDSPPARSRMKNEPQDERSAPSVTRLVETVPTEDANKMPIRRRLQRMGMDDKINLALSGGKEERMALAMDGNKAIHHYLLRNARISLDEIAYMARLPGLNPDVLEKIAETPGYTQNPSVVKALVYNPKTPVLTAIRLLDRLPRQEVLNLSKRMNMNQRLVMAAKKKIEGKRW